MSLLGLGMFRNVPFVGRHGYLIGALVVTAGACLLSFLKPGQPQGEQIERMPGVTAPEGSSQSTQLLNHQVATQLPDPSGAPQGERQKSKRRHETDLLLTLRAGHVSALEANKFVAALKEDVTAVRQGVDQLTSSSNLVDRVLGFYLLLESAGPSDELLKRALADSSDHIRAEVAGWLYKNGRFEEWDRFLNDSMSSVKINDIESMFTLLDSKPIRLDLPAALSLLGLGRGLPDYAVEVLRRNAESVAAARRQLSAANTPTVRKENLLALLHQANPASYTDILRDVIAVAEDDSPLRWQAVQNYGLVASNSQALAFVSNWLSQHPADRLQDKLLEFMATVSNRMSMAESPVVQLERHLRKQMQQRTVPGPNARSLLLHYVNMSKREPTYVPDLGLLEHAKTEYFTNTVADQPFKQALADINYVIWRAKRN